MRVLPRSELTNASPTAPTPGGSSRPRANTTSAPGQAAATAGGGTIPNIGANNATAARRCLMPRYYERFPASKLCIFYAFGSPSVELYTGSRGAHDGAVRGVGRDGPGRGRGTRRRIRARRLRVQARRLRVWGRRLRVRPRRLRVKSGRLGVGSGHGRPVPG